MAGGRVCRRDRNLTGPPALQVHLPETTRGDPMRRLLAGPAALLPALLVFLPVADSADPVPVAAGGKQPVAAAEGHTLVPPDSFQVPEGWELTVWAKAPMFRKPTNMDVDRFGRVWLCEGWRYRGKAGREPAGDRIMVLEDTDGDGTADKSWAFTQEKGLVAPLGIAVIGDKIVVSQSPDLIVYTDVNGDAKFDPAVDKRGVLLTGFGGNNHDHGLHALTVGPDGWWYFNTGNAGEHVVRDRGGKLVQSGSHYSTRDKSIAGKPSDDGHVYVGGMALRVRPDGTDLQVIGHNFRNSYEQAVTSFGDVFQSDNDDTSSCRTSWLMEYGNAGFCSPDGRRGWQADIRRGQKTPVSHWHQEDPGVLPHADIYGAGAPTGVVFIEGDELGKDFRGSLLCCETALNTIFRYQPVPAGAGFKLDRQVWLTSNKERKFLGTDSTGGGKTGTGAPLHVHFRPSDIAVMPDGAILIADWCDGRSGGHQTLDEKGNGTIYRLAPKGFQAKKIKYDLDTVPGLIETLKSPAVNVRALGFAGLKAKGAEALPAVEALLGDPNPYHAARAVWLLAQMGPAGAAKVAGLLRSDDPMMRIAAFRALRRERIDVLKHAAALAADGSPAVRREVALALRDVPYKDCKDLLAKLAEGYDGQDAYYLEALGTGCWGKEAEVWNALFPTLGGPADKWDARFAGITWRLHPPQALPHLKARIRSSALPYAERRRMMTALAFVDNKPAAEAMLEFALDLSDEGDEGELKKDAAEWVKQKGPSAWKDYGVLARLPKSSGGTATKAAPKVEDKNPLPKLTEVLQLAGDPAKGKELFYGKANCAQCHKAGEAKGGVVGPELAQAGRKYSREVILDSILNPSASIALGYEGTVIRTQDGKILTGIVVAEGDPVILRDPKGEQISVASGDIEARKKSDLSIMPELKGLGLTAQDIADVAAFVESLK
jgi:putative membrane-bound dehydrogenase-like protein